MDYQKNQYNMLTIYFYFCDPSDFLLEDDIKLNIISESEYCY